MTDPTKPFVFPEETYASKVEIRIIPRNTNGTKPVKTKLQIKACFHPVTTTPAPPTTMQPSTTAAPTTPTMEPTTQTMAPTTTSEYLRCDISHRFNPSSCLLKNQWLYFNHFEILFILRIVGHKVLIIE